MPTDEFLKNDAFLTTELLKLAVEAAGIGVWKVDPQTRNVELTAVLKQMLGIPVDQPMNYAAFFAALHPDEMSPRDALEALYASLSPIQQRTADQVFRQGPGG